MEHSRRDPIIGGALVRRRERGQSLAIAITVMFVLLFIGGLFVGIVARNLLNAARSRDTLSAEQFAEAGIRYASEFLENSPEGADWRPTPTPIPTDFRDPDRRWLSTGAYTRVPLTNGRALIQVSLKPDPRNPLGKLIRIESVGRSGFLDPTDPTTFLNTPAPRLNRRRVAYKALGLIDYLRFVTNRDKDTRLEATLGVPAIGVPVWMQLGGLPVRTAGSLPASMQYAVGAPIRVNGDLRLMHNVTLAVQPRFNESVMVSGQLRVDPADAQDPASQSARFSDLSVNAGNVDPLGTPLGAGAGLPEIIASSRTDFSTFGGLLRDGNPDPDNNPSSSGYARSIPPLQPPVLDGVDQSTQVPRYRTLTRDSGPSVQRGAGGPWVNTGAIGLGAGIYIDNPGSVERETNAVDGGQSLRSVWLRPGSSPNWNGPYYIPPGAFVEFGYQLVEDQDGTGAPIPGQYVSRPGVRVVRDAGDRAFRDPAGVLGSRQRVYTFFIYKATDRRPVIKLENAEYRAFLKTYASMTDSAVDRFLPEFNGVLYAEGNLRVRGLIPSLSSMPVRQETESVSDAQVRGWTNAPALTLVSGACIYVEGSIVRQDPSAMVALLAQNCVVVNTTLFVAPNKNLPFASSQQDEQEPFHANIGVAEAANTPPFGLDFIFGDNPNGYTAGSGGSTAPLTYLTRHGCAPGQTFLNLVINEAFPTAPGVNTFYQFNSSGVPAWVYPMSNASTGADVFEQRGFPLLPISGNYQLLSTPGLVNTIRPAVDPNYANTMGAQDYLFGRSTIVPLDVRIEAVAYAYGGSFFIIPGYPMNVDPQDTPASARRRAEALEATGPMVRPSGTGDMFPFYGEPVDIRVTWLGAISENRTASPADQAAWMRLWGYIPVTYGSTGQTTGSPSALSIPQEHLNVGEVGRTDPDYRAGVERAAGVTRGLRFLYDPALHAPYQGYDPDAGSSYVATGWRHVEGGAFRQDDYGRTLPPLPRLPVCPGLVFEGEE